MKAHNARIQLLNKKGKLLYTSAPLRALMPQLRGLGLADKCVCKDKRIAEIRIIDWRTNEDDKIKWSCEVSQKKPLDAYD